MHIKHVALTLLMPVFMFGITDNAILKDFESFFREKSPTNAFLNCFKGNNCEECQTFKAAVVATTRNTRFQVWEHKIAAGLEKGTRSLEDLHERYSQAEADSQKPEKENITLILGAEYREARINKINGLASAIPLIHEFARERSCKNAR